MTPKWIPILYIVSAIYDGLLGLAFLILPTTLFNTFNVPLPNHWGYVQFPAGILIIFAIMFVNIAIDPHKNRNLIPYGILLKFCYSGLVFGYWFTIGIPNMWKPFAVCDLIFAVLFIWSYIQLTPREIQTASVEGQ